MGQLLAAEFTHVEHLLGCMSNRLAGRSQSFQHYEMKNGGKNIYNPRDSSQ